MEDSQDYTPPAYKAYGTPGEIVTNAALPKEEKIELLQLWRSDIEALIEATTEGLGGGKQPNLKELRQVLESLQELGEA